MAIPEWFQYPSYHLLDEFNAEQMRELLNEKKHLYKDIKSHLDEGYSKNYLRRCFLRTIFSVEYPSEGIYAEFLEFISKRQEYDQIETVAKIGIDISPIEDVNFNDLLGLLESIAMQSSNLAEKLGLHLIELSKSSKRKSLKHKIETQTNSHLRTLRMKKIYKRETRIKAYEFERLTDKTNYFRLVGCDLSQSDIRLKNYFADWLKNQREVVKKHKLKKTIDNKIIPFIDLYIWRLITDKKLTYQNIADTLYPNKDHLYISQTIKPFALKAITDDFINSLID